MVVAWSAVALFALATAGWVLSVIRRNANVVDEFWGMGQIVLTATCLTVGEITTVRSWLCAALVVTWGLRLTAYLAARNRDRGEDWRHREARDHRPRFVWRSLPEVFWLQLVGGGLVIGLPVFAVVSVPQPALSWVDGLGVVIWAVGFSVETIADKQLARFRSDPANRGCVMHRGLWRYSRHPNYFGETAVWVGIALLGVAAGSWWALLSPVMVLIIVLRISGVAAMEAHLGATRGDQYATYMRTTSAFVPLPKRSAT